MIFPELSQEMEKSQFVTQSFYTLKNEKLNLDWKLKQVRFSSSLCEFLLLQTETILRELVEEKSHESNEMEDEIVHLENRMEEEKIQASE
jgi:hypothetical protein